MDKICEIIVKEKKYDVFMDKFKKDAPELYEMFTEKIMVQSEEMLKKEKVKRKFIKVSKEQKEVLLYLLDIDPYELICKYCGKETTAEECSVMPDNDDCEVIILCKSVVCLSEYMTEMDD